MCGYKNDYVRKHDKIYSISYFLTYSTTKAKNGRGFSKKEKTTGRMGQQKGQQKGKEKGGEEGEEKGVDEEGQEEQQRVGVNLLWRISHLLKLLLLTFFIPIKNKNC